MAAMARSATSVWRWTFLAVAGVTWALGFAVLVRLGTWTPFAVVGPVMAALALVFTPAIWALLRPSLGRVVIGFVAGALMVVATHAAFAAVALRLPVVRTATVELYGLLNVGGFSSWTRAGLIAVIATCEEILFRGVLAGPADRGGERHLVKPLDRRDGASVALLAVVYMTATLTTGRALLVACAFACGTAWGAMRAATRSLVPPIVMHVVWDLGVLVLWPLV